MISKIDIYFDSDTENDKEVKASWEDFKNSENSKSPEPGML